MSYELMLKIAGLIFTAGIIYGELKAIRKDIVRLETKVEKHNNFDRRIVKLETMIELEQQERHNEELAASKTTY